jgi:hypothetical protein
MPALLLILLLVALLLFIRWDRKRIENAPSSGLALSLSATHQGRTLSRLFAAMAIVVACFAYLKWNDPAQFERTRRIRFFSQLLLEVLGPNGPAIGLVALSVVLLVLAHKVWRRTPKRPTDKWFF